MVDKPRCKWQIFSEFFFAHRCERIFTRVWIFQSSQTRVHTKHRSKKFKLTHRSACRTAPVASIPDSDVEIAPSTSKSLKWLCTAPVYPVCPLSPVYPGRTIHIARPRTVAAFLAVVTAASSTAATSREASENTEKNKFKKLN